jgi:hypothetical protein
MNQEANVRRGVGSMNSEKDDRLSIVPVNRLFRPSHRRIRPATAEASWCGDPRYEEFHIATIACTVSAQLREPEIQELTWHKADARPSGL